MPGPGTYSFKEKFGVESAKYSIHGSKEDFSLTQKVFGKINVPGPGTYDTSIDKTIGKSVISNYKSSPVAVISPPTSLRFPKRKDFGFPGPGSYSLSQEFLKSSSIESKFKYCGARKFTQSARKIFEKVKFETPGPGSYRMPSEFGYYENTRNSSLPERKQNK